MIVHYDKEERKDLVFTIKEGENNHIEIIIDQQRPPCGDFKQIGHYAVPVPEELTEEKIFTIKQSH
jgi:hypothetical protein